MKYQGKHIASTKKSRSFRAQLAKELGVETPPESFRRAMEKTYKELPMDMPAAYRPVRTFLRRMATAAVVCGLTFLSLLGVNTTYPQLTEALPGLGMVFQAINSGNRQIPPDQEPDHSRLMLEDATPTPEPTPQPTFQPVILPPVGDVPFGDLTVEDAWSDGIYFWLDMSLEVDNKDLRETLSEMVFDEVTETMQPRYSLCPGAPDSYTDDEGIQHDEVVSNSQLTWNGIETSLPTAPGFTWDAERQKATASFFIPISFMEGEADGSAAQEGNPSREYSQGPTLVHLLISSLTLVDNFSEEAGGLVISNYFETGYGGKFQLETDSRDNRVMQPMAEDNGATIQSITYTPSEIFLDVELPNIGFGMDTLVSPSAHMEWDTGAPLGIYADLVRKAPDSGNAVSQAKESGVQIEASEPEAESSVYYTMELLSVNGLSGFDFTQEEWSDSNSLRYVFRSPGKPEDRDLPLVLTFYETPCGSNFVQPGYTLDYNPRVLAEFTIDPKQGIVYTSDNYMAEYREKVETPRTSGIHGSYENGFLCAGANSGGLGEEIWLASPEDMTSRNFCVIGYRNDEPVALFTWQAGYGEGDEFGQYTPSQYTLPSGETIYISNIHLLYPEFAVSEDISEDSSWFTRLELQDSDTGEVLISDLQANAAQVRLEALGSWVNYQPEEPTPSPVPTVRPIGPTAPVPWKDSGTSSQLEEVRPPSAVE